MRVPLRARREQVLAFRARASHLDRKLPAGSLTRAAYAGLQDTLPRAGVIGLHARVEGVESTSWDDPSLCQIWFRGGADYIIPRSDIGIFTLGSRPRDEVICAAADAVADRVVGHLAGRQIRVREVQEALGFDHPMAIRSTGITGRVLIRWNASLIWVYACEPPDIDVQDARLELARRYLHWLGPQTVERFAWWAGIKPRDAKVTWDALRSELEVVELDGRERFVLERDADALRDATPVEGVRLVHNDDPLLKDDHQLIAPDAERRRRLYPRGKESPGYAVCALLVDGDVAGVWQRQQRKVTIHPWRKLSKKVRVEIEAEALSFPIAARSAASVSWVD